MARNEEKAHSMLSRFTAMKQEEQEEQKKPKERRPFFTSAWCDLAEAYKWRQQIMPRNRPEGRRNPERRPRRAPPPRPQRRNQQIDSGERPLGVANCGDRLSKLCKKFGQDD
ncbi:hypothetical protein Ancab_023884 [Ancistrocladus abbreviatus]